MVDQLERVAIGVATVGNHPLDWREEILPARESWITRADMLKNQEPAAGSQDTGGLGEGVGGFLDCAQREREDDGVEFVIVERKALRVPQSHLDADTWNRQTGGGPPKHACVGIQEDDVVDRGRIVIEVGSGSGSNVEDTAARTAQERPSARTQCLLLHRGVDPVVNRGRDPLHHVWSEVILRTDSRIRARVAHNVIA